MTTPNRLLALAVAASAFLLAACGDATPPTTTTADTGPLTKDAPPTPAPAPPKDALPAEPVAPPAPPAPEKSSKAEPGTLPRIVYYEISAA